MSGFFHSQLPSLLVLVDSSAVLVSHSVTTTNKTFAYLQSCQPRTVTEQRRRNERQNRNRTSSDGLTQSGRSTVQKNARPAEGNSKITHTACALEVILRLPHYFPFVPIGTKAVGARFVLPVLISGSARNPHISPGFRGTKTRYLRTKSHTLSDFYSYPTVLSVAPDSLHLHAIPSST